MKPFKHMLEVSKTWTRPSAFSMKTSDSRGGIKQHRFATTKLNYVPLLFSYYFDNYSSVTSTMLEVQRASSDIKMLVITRIHLQKGHRKGLIASIDF